MKNQVEAAYISYLKLSTVFNVNFGILEGRGAQIVPTLWVTGRVSRRAAVGDPALYFRTQTTTLATHQ